MKTNIGETLLELLEGDITDQDTDAVVNAAHWDLRGGQGVDGAIHWKGGPRIPEECKRIGGCPIGGAVVTSGGDLKASHVIHAVGPVYDAGDEHEADLLASVYRNSLQLAVDNNCKSVSFPSLSTGAFNYPLRLAAPVAMRSIVEFLRHENHQLQTVRFVLYPREQPQAYSIYAQALKEMLAES
jgi:O-acetyl-ADP-ribose deacetylase (regulator of RNase III)